MVYTFKITSLGGIELENGCIVMVGERNRQSAEEVNQRMRIRFKIQLGSKPLHPFAGFDYIGLSESTKDLDSDEPLSVRDLIELNVRRTVSQEKEVDPNLDALEITEERDRHWQMDIQYHTLQEQQGVIEQEVDV